MTSIDYDALQHHPFSENLAEAIAEKVGKDDRSFFRIHIAYYLATVAGAMRTSFQMPNSKVKQSIGIFGLNLAPSGFGKGHSTNIIETQVIDKFMDIYLEDVLPAAAEENIIKIAHKRAVRDETDPDEELEKTRKEYERFGAFNYFNGTGTAAAIKQVCDKLLMAKSGSLNIAIDEIGSNLTANKELLILFLELFDGKSKPKLIKNTSDSKRTEAIKGIVPTNLMGFGVGSALLDGSKTEEEFLSLLASGYARRCFFGFVPENHQEALVLKTPEELLKIAKNGTADTTLGDVSNHIGALASFTNADRVLIVPDDTAILYFTYDNDCKKRAHVLKEFELLPKSELQHRAFKTMRLAAVYAFVDGSAEITPDHLKSAIKVSEESGEAFKNILKRDRSYVKFAKYLAAKGDEVTQADLIEDLPFYRGPASARSDLLAQAQAWGYRNNILIRKRFQDSIEFFRGEALQPTDLKELTLSHSTNLAEGYRAELAPFDQLHKLTQLSNHHWCTHHFKDEYRNDDNTIPGFNLVVIDVDSGISLPMAKSMLKGYKALFYTTKSHTPQANRFRIILPTNYTLKLDKEDFKEFMSNLFEWMPFDSDTSTGQRSRKWLSFNGNYEYLDGKLLDVLPFIPKTTKNEERKIQYKELGSLDGLERWVVQNTGDGNRNNQLFRFAAILVDGGHDYNTIQSKVLAMNEKLSNKLTESEILSTIMTTVAKKIATRSAA